MSNKIGTIYLITCRQTGEQYVGLTIKQDVRLRWREHFRAAKMQPPKETALYDRMRRFGKRGFRYDVLMTAPIEELYIHERRLISELNTMWPNGLNLTAGGESSTKRTLIDGRDQELVKSDRTDTGSSEGCDTEPGDTGSDS